MKYDKQFLDKGKFNFFGRIDRTRKVIIDNSRLSKNDIVLDVGCDRGELVNLCKPLCKRVYGIDLNKDAITASENSLLKCMDATEMSFPNEYFTKVISSHTVEHVLDLNKFFLEIDRVTAPGGQVILCYPWELYKGMGTMRNAWIFYKNPFAGYKIHVNRLSHRKISKLIIGTRLKLAKKSFFFDPFPAYLTILEKS